MELEWLQTFIIAAEEENFRRTAERLHVAQPTVTQHIQKLELAWGLSLFERSGRNVRLSSAGKEFLRHAKRMMHVYQRGREEMTRWQQGYDEVVTIAASPLVATTVLPGWIHRFSREHPNVEFSIQVRESHAILNELMRHECHVGLTRVDPAQATVERVRLYSDPIVMVAPAEPQDLDGPPLDASELLASYPLLTHNHPEYWDGLVATLRRLFPNIRTMQVTQVHVAIHWIVEKVGVSFLPASTVKRELMRGNLMEVSFPFFTLPTTHTYMLTHPAVTTRAGYAFADFVQSYVRQRTF